MTRVMTRFIVKREVYVMIDAVSVEDWVEQAESMTITDINERGQDRLEDVHSFKLISPRPREWNENDE